MSWSNWMSMFNYNLALVLSQQLFIKPKKRLLSYETLTAERLMRVVYEFTKYIRLCLFRSFQFVMGSNWSTLLAVWGGNGANDPARRAQRTPEHLKSFMFVLTCKDKQCIRNVYHYKTHSDFLHVSDEVLVELQREQQDLKVQSLALCWIRHKRKMGRILGFSAGNMKTQLGLSC